MHKLLKEPFVHFVILGGLLFTGHAFWQKHITKTERTIFVSTLEMERQKQSFTTENRREPTDEEVEGLLFAHIEEQVLMREAQRLGLDAHDTIIRRRLAQKMRFMIDDIGIPALPSREVLKDWYASNPDFFMRPETRGFEHIYLSPRGRSDTVSADAQALLAAGVPTDWKSEGDRFLTGRTFQNLAAPAVERDFGTRFSTGLFALPGTTDWQGPLVSAFGVHLVRLTKVTPETLPPFEDITGEVEAVWLEQAKRAETAEALITLIEKYDVEVGE